MKKFIKYTNFILIVGLLSSCINLEKDFNQSLTREQIESQYDYVKRLSNGLYLYMEDGLNSIDGAMQASVSDEAEYTYTHSVQTFNTGSWNAYNNPDNVWSTYFEGIRRTNFFLESSSSVNLDVYKNDPNPSSQELYRIRMTEINNWKYEARFLRAYYYFELIKRYGGVPLLESTLALNANFSEIPRNTLEECINFITKECDEVSKEGALPISYSNENLGRVTKGAAMALKSRILLYAASELFNNTSWTNGYSHPELISLKGDRIEKWRKAAEAAKELINLPGANYELSDYNLIGKTYDNSELILVRRSNASNFYEFRNYPIGYAVGDGAVTPSQNLVDDYEMTNGTSFDWSNPTHAKYPYYNRDPRLQMSVYFNQSKFKTNILDMSTGGVNGKGVIYATKTGYYIKRFIDEDLDVISGRTSVHSWPIFRIAEIYLNYAEALNEYDPGNPDILFYVNKIRSRAGVNMPNIISGLSQEQMRDRIRKERRIEFAFEGHRLWDTRRWMTAVAELSKPLYGVEITATDFDYLYKRIEVEKRVFEPKMYFYPIPQSVLNTVGVSWAQNPIW